MSTKHREEEEGRTNVVDTFTASAPREGHKVHTADRAIYLDADGNVLPEGEEHQERAMHVVAQVGDEVDHAWAKKHGVISGEGDDEEGE